MAQELRGELPAMREIIVSGGDGMADMTSFAELAGDPIEERCAVSSLEGLRPQGGAPAVFQLSGGSTGLPKVIPRTHDDYLYNSYLMAMKSGYEADGVALIALPMMHNFPLAGAIQPGLLTGAKIVFVQRADAASVSALVERERVTWICAVPPMVVSWLADPGLKPARLGSLKSLAVGGARLNPETARCLLGRIGPVLTQIYGMAEGLICTTRPDDPEEVIVETQGRPVSEADEYRIVDDELHDVAAGELGELITRGPYTIRGYYNADEYNQTAFTPDGFYRTGDMVRLHPSGNLIVEGAEQRSDQSRRREDQRRGD
jgi:2,3-dihydroxybenzoate-AMP ligase